MPRTLTFQQITDERFGGTKEMLIERNKNLLAALSQCPALEVHVSDVREIDWPSSKYAPVAHKQWRSDYYVKKINRSITWNDVYGIVNRFKAVPYNFI